MRKKLKGKRFQRDSNQNLYLIKKLSLQVPSSFDRILPVVGFILSPRTMAEVAAAKINNNPPEADPGHNGDNLWSAENRDIEIGAPRQRVRTRAAARIDKFISFTLSAPER